MTDTEAKALALVNEHALNRRDDLLDAKTSELHCALLDAVQAQATTEARHAAEMRELKERFGEAAAKVSTMLATRGTLRDNPLRQTLAPFIIPAPDPLAEALKEADAPAIGKDGYDAMAERTRAAMQARGYEWRKIGEAGE